MGSNPVTTEASIVQISGFSTDSPANPATLSGSAILWIKIVWNLAKIFINVQFVSQRIKI